LTIHAKHALFEPPGNAMTKARKRHAEHTPCWRQVPPASAVWILAGWAAAAQTTTADA
jgi:hypothetical protein